MVAADPAVPATVLSLRGAAACFLVLAALVVFPVVVAPALVLGDADSPLFAVVASRALVAAGLLPAVAAVFLA